jgi:flagellar basal body-associated protein FliL
MAETAKNPKTSAFVHVFVIIAIVLFITVAIALILFCFINSKSLFLS